MLSNTELTNPSPARTLARPGKPLLPAPAAVEMSSLLMSGDGSKHSSRGVQRVEVGRGDDAKETGIVILIARVSYRNTLVTVKHGRTGTECG